MEKRRKYSEEFKREAVGLTRQPGASVSEVGRDIGVGANLLFRWRREFEGKKAFPGSGVARDQELELGPYEAEWIVNLLHDVGILGPPDDSNAREVLVRRDKFDPILASLKASLDHDLAV